MGQQPTPLNNYEPDRSAASLSCAACALRITLGVWMLCVSLVSWAETDFGAREASAWLKTYCGRCHNDYQFYGNWSLSDVNASEVSRGENLPAWEKIFRMTLENTMPPPDRKQPSVEERAALTRWLQQTLDNHAAENPDPGRATLRRLNRTEYANAIRDLLNVDIALDLPPDDSGYGFDNIADVLSVSSTLMDRYFLIAGKVSRLAVGLGTATPVLTTHRVPKNGSILNQGIPAHNQRMSSALPIDSRGGDSFSYFAPQDGSYIISGYLNANTNNEVDRLEENRYQTTVSLSAGLHAIGMSFRKQFGLDESVQTLRNDTDIVPMPTSPPKQLTLDFIVDGARTGSVAVPSYHMSPRYAQHNFPRDVLQIDVEGPFNPTGAKSHPSRRAIFSCSPGDTEQSEIRCAKQIIAEFSRRAYRRPTSEQDTQALFRVFEATRTEAGFDAALASVIQAVLISPSFLFIQEPPAQRIDQSANYRISDYELATRLALFLWSSVPDDELLELARRNRLHRPRVLRGQLKRMLADDKSVALTKNFAGQWLYLRNLEHHRPDVMAYPEFDIPLRNAMRAETERFFSAIVHNNRSLLELIDADYSYLNERLARHYNIEGVKGEQLRRVTFPSDAPRGGLLGQASLLTLTSYGNHTSVVKRGYWILNNLLAAPPPPPPPDVPALVTTANGSALNAREQLAMHRADPACAACHVKMDPMGLALENYDAIGAYRTLDAGRPIEATAELPDGRSFSGIAGLRSILVAHKDQFARAFTEQLLTYALGRGMTATDQPTIRAIASKAAAEEYRIQSVILGIVESYPFNFRRASSL